MNVRKLISATAAIAIVAAATPAYAGGTFAWSADDEHGTGSSGMVRAYDWDGGDGGGFGDEGTLEAAMNYAANEEGNFSGSPFKARCISIFIVDFTGNETYGDAGLTVFVMWGNGQDPGGDFVAEVDVSRRVEEGNDGDFSAGVAEIFALGDGVEIDSGNLTVDVDVNNNDTPVGYAITNFRDFPGLRINQQFTTAGSIKRFKLIGEGNDEAGGVVYKAIDDDRSDDIFTDGIVLIVPAPPAAAWGLAGLAGLALVSRRRSSKKSHS